MTGASWSRWGEQDCILLAGARSAPGPEPVVEVRAQAAAVAAVLPPMAGRLVHAGEDLCFVPRYPFLAGTTYTVLVDGVEAASLVRPRPDRPAVAEVLAIYPATPEVPRNLLRMYVWFSVPMSEGCARSHVRLVDQSGAEMAGTLLDMEHELWDPQRRRLTVLLDPARIKRGLVAHRRIGYPLQTGEPFRVVVDQDFRDAHGSGLRVAGTRSYAVGADERRRVDPAGWRLAPPAVGTVERFEVGFDRPLDHALIGRCLRVFDPSGDPVDGAAEIGPAERSWRFRPNRPWADGDHRLVVDPVLEDLAGNSVGRVFDRDLESAAGGEPLLSDAQLVFRPR